MAFQDGFGERRRGQDPSGAELDLLCVRKDLANVPSFEFALRERVNRLSAFRHPSYARVRAIERSSAAEDSLVIVSDHTDGIRLSELLSGCAGRRLAIDVGAALCLIRQLVPAVAILHESVRDASHGGIAPERLLVTPNSRLVVTEYVLGSALEQLLYARERYWTQLRVALPRVAGLARFDHLADVTQIGVVALSLVLGRPLNDDDYPGHLADLVAGAEVSSGGDREPLPPVLRSWLERTLQMDPRHSFPSAIEARTALDRVVEECGYDTSPARLEALIARFQGTARAATALDSAALDSIAPGPSARSVAPLPLAPLPLAPSLRPPIRVPASAPAASAAAIAAAAPIGPVAPSPNTVSAAASPALASPAPAFRAARDVPPPMFLMTHGASDGPATDDEIPMDRQRETRGRGKALMAAAVVGAVLAGSGATMAARRFLAERPAKATTTGTLTVTTEPPGAHASVDGVTQGITPLTVALAAGPHTLQLRGEHGAREIRLTITAGVQAAQYIDLPGESNAGAGLPDALLMPAVFAAVAEAVEPAAEAAPVAGWIGVTGRFDVQVFEGGKLLGSSESDRIMVVAGRHDLEFVNEALGYHGARTVHVAAGKVAAVVLDAPKGTIALNAVPWAEVVIDGEKAGETPLGNVSLTIGSHEILFRHPELGEQRRQVAITLKAPARLSVDLRSQ